ncbi:MAG: hypothetical protein ABIR79_20790 [Candidatus Binatia bacterium]
MTTSTTTALATLIRAELARPVPPGAHALTARLRERFGPALRAVLMYGSNLRAGDDREGVLDLYALVSDYDAAYESRALAAANRWLPPNVFYLEAAGEGGDDHIIRSKYAVLALDELPRLTARPDSEPYFWARFAQPCALVWVADEAARTIVVNALVSAVTTFVRFGVAFAPTPFDARALWTSAWRATYGAEVRPERPGAADGFYEANAARFEDLTALVVPSLPWPVTTVEEGGRTAFRLAMPEWERAQALRAWRRRRLQAKGLFLLRILRNGLIFEGGADYVLWKIQRHSGVLTDRSWREKRHPLLALGAEAWRLYRARAFR